MIDKSLYEAPEGLEALILDDVPDIEIDIVELDDDGAELEDGEASMDGSLEDDFDANLAEYLDDSVIQSLVSELISDYEDDVASRRDWMQTYVDGLQLLGL